MKSKPIVRFVGLSGSGEGQRRGLTRSEWLARLDTEIASTEARIAQLLDQVEQANRDLSALRKEREAAAAGRLPSRGKTNSDD